MSSDLNKWSSPDIPPVEGENVKFKRKGGLFLSKKFIITTLILFIILIIAAILITKKLTERQYNKTEEDVPDSTSTSENSPLIHLSDDIIPNHYEVNLRPYLEISPLDDVEPFTLLGDVLIYFTIMKPTSTVTLHYAGMYINCTDMFKDNKSMEIKSAKYDRSLELFSIESEESLQPGAKYSIKLVFNNSISDEQKGFYRSSYIVENTSKQKWMGVTQLEPTYARRLLPCFDEPKFRTTFVINVHRLKNMTTLANTNVAKTYADQENSAWIWDTFERTPAMPTHKLSIVVADLIVTKLNVKNFTTSIWTRRDLFNISVNIVDITNSLLNYYYFNYFKVNHPIVKLDLVAVPDFINEDTGSWGLIIFSESLLFEKNDHMGEVKYGLEMSKKLAEQWFGNLVSINWWTDLWLKNGLCTYLGYRVLNKIRPNYEIMSSFVVDVLQKSLDYESYPIPEEVLVLDAWSSHYSSLKGASLFQMIASLSPNNSLQSGINSYLEKWSEKVATSNHLWESLNSSFEQNDFDLTKFTTKWTKSGYPVVSVKYNRTNGDVTIGQKPFYLQYPSAVGNSNWDIPLMYSTNESILTEENYKKIWLKSNSTPLRFILHNGTWLLMNSPQQGFYRVNYNQENWNLLIDNLLKGNTIDERVKASLLDDSYQLAKAGSLPYTVPLNITQRLLKDTSSFSILPTLDTHLNFLRQFFRYGNDTILFKNFVLKLFLPHLKYALNSTSLSNNNTSRIYDNAVLLKWTCQYDIPECKNWALSHYTKWLNNNTMAMEPTTFYNVVLKTGMRLSTSNNIEAVTNRSLSNNISPKKRLQILESLTSSSNSSFVLKLLEDTLQLKEDEKNRKFTDEEVIVIWESLITNININENILNFVSNNSIAIYKKFQSNNKVLDAIFKGATEGFIENVHINNVASLKNNIMEQSKMPLRSLEFNLNRLIVNAGWKASKYSVFKKLIQT